MDINEFKHKYIVSINKFEKIQLLLFNLFVIILYSCNICITQNLILLIYALSLYSIRLINHLLLIYLPSLYLYLTRATGFQQSGQPGWCLLAILKNSGHFYKMIADQYVDQPQLNIT